MKHRPVFLFRFRDEAQYEEVKELVNKRMVRSMNEFIMAAVAQRLDDFLGPQEGQD